MKHILLIISFAILFASCGVIKKNTNKQEDKQEQTTAEKKNEKTLTDRQKQRQREKEIQANRKKQLEENKRRDKEFAKKKKQEEKEKRRKEKEQDDIIKNAAKTERQRIKEERKKEKETLLSSQKLAEQEADAQIKKQQELDAQEKQRLADEQEKEKLLAKQEKEIAEQTKKEEQELLKQEKEKAEQEKKAKQEERKKKFESLSTMDQIVYRMQHPEEEIEQEEEHAETQDKNSDSTVTTLTDSEKKKIIASKGKEEGNFFKRTYRKIFPKKEARSTIYSKIYEEKPLTIMVAYPWNRSEYKAASEMAYTACVKELSEKGYYLLPALSFMDELKKDTTKNTKYLTPEQIKSFKEKYNVDAVLLLTIYRVEKPWWSTNINVVTHYDLISTQSLDTLFVRHADFNYDSPMPVKEKNNKKLLNDPEQLLYLGLFERMQKYVFLDLPAGPYHKDYQQDKKRKAEQQEVKYKVTIKPS